MALERSGFFDSIIEEGQDPDRLYQADAFAEFWRACFSSGVHFTPKNNNNDLLVTNGSGRSVNVNYGYANLEGYLYGVVDNGAGVFTLTPDAASAQSRIDRVIVRRDLSTPVRNTYAYIKKGTAASSPEPPELLREGNVYELSLAQLMVTSSGVVITDERRDDSACGIAEPHVMGELLDQDLKTTSSPTFNEITANKVTASVVVGAVYQ